MNWNNKRCISQEACRLHVWGHDKQSFEPCLVLEQQPIRIYRFTWWDREIIMSSMRPCDGHYMWTKAGCCSVAIILPALWGRWVHEQSGSYAPQKSEGAQSTVPWKVFIPLPFFHILFSILQPYSKIDSIFFSLINLHTIPHNDKAKRGF